MQTTETIINMTNVIRYKHVFNLAERYFDLEDKTISYSHDSELTEIKVYRDKTMIAKMALDSLGVLTILS